MQELLQLAFCEYLPYKAFKGQKALQRNIRPYKARGANEIQESRRGILGEVYGSIGASPPLFIYWSPQNPSSMFPGFIVHPWPVSYPGHVTMWISQYPSRQQTARITTLRFVIGAFQNLSNGYKTQWLSDNALVGFFQRCCRSLQGAIMFYNGFLWFQKGFTRHYEALQGFTGSYKAY